MSNNYNPYDRLQTYYNWLINDQSTTFTDEDYDFGMPICRLAEKTGSPKEIIRMDVAALFEWRGQLTIYDAGFDFLTPIEFVFDSPEFIAADKEHHLSLLDDHLEGKNLQTLKALFIQGHLDQVPLHIDNLRPDNYTVSLTADEAQAFSFYRKTIAASDSSYPTKSAKNKLPYSFLDIKDSYRYKQTYICNLNEMLEKINQAICNKTALSICYLTNKGKHKFFDFIPLKIAYDATENLYYVLTFDDSPKNYRLDRIIKLENSKKQLKMPDTSFLEKAPQVWGMNFSCETPTHVKVRFSRSANVEKKVKKELEFRTKKKLSESDEFLYYEDDVYGLSKFKDWILSYGWSAVVLEPQSLQEEIIASYTIRKDYYPEFNSENA